MAQADLQFKMSHAVLRNPETDLETLSGRVAIAALEPEPTDPIFDAMKAHKRELERRNQTIEAICAAEDRYKAEERDAWKRYEEVSIALLTTKPTSMAGLIALMNYVALPECSGPGACETILNGARLSSNSEAATAADRFPALSADALQKITGQR